MDTVLRLNEFFVEGGRQQISHVLLHITEPSTTEEMAKGYFFAVCEINHAETRYIAKLQDLIDKAENDYYELSDEGDKTAFETIIERINQEAYSFLKPEVELHCIIGVIRSPEIIFSYYGQPQLLLLYKNRQGSYQTMDLLHDEAGSEEDNASNQLFSELVQGKISPGDYIFVGTAHIIDYFSPDRLGKIITSRPSAESAQHLERVLHDLKNGFSFGGLIINLEYQKIGAQTKKTRPPGLSGSTESLTNLFNTERDTANMLSPSLLPNLFGSGEATRNKESVTAASKPITNNAQIHSTHLKAHQAKMSNSGVSSEHQETLLTILRGAGAAGLIFLRTLVWLVVSGYNLLFAFGRNLFLLFFVITNYHNRRKNILDDWRRAWRSHRENLHQLPAVTKMLLIAALVIAFVFIGSLIYMHHRAAQIAEAKAFAASVQSITAEKDAAESALVYKDQAGALNNFKTAASSLKNLNCISTEEKNTCATLQNELADLSGRIRKITVVTPTVLADEAGLLAGNTLTGLVKIGTKLIGYSNTTSSLFLYDLQTKQTSRLSTGVTGGFSAAAVPKENDYAIFVYAQNKLLRFDPTNDNTKTIDVSYSNSNVSITGIAVYNRRLYSLDNAHGQIYRHDPIQTGFGPGTPWLASPVGDLSQGVGLTIDGDIYILENNGHIAKFTSGAADQFSVQGLDPSLTSGNALWTYTDQNYLYIIDANTKRLIILNKDGTLKAQLTSETFNSPAGLAIDPDTNTAYIADQTKLLTVPLPQQ